MLRNMLNNSILLKLEALLIRAGRESRNESAEMTSYHNAEILYQAGLITQILKYSYENLTPPPSPTLRLIPGKYCKYYSQVYCCILSK